MERQALKRLDGKTGAGMTYYGQTEHGRVWHRLFGFRLHFGHTLIARTPCLKRRTMNIVGFVTKLPPGARLCKRCFKEE